ncbi:MAG TPA: hypothetical protein PK854_00920 [Oscillospiraceae bacterium]|nr:hypothetical protein [Oscillospiraceae bacterium]HPS33815.1 hypothetical protein [Oscillospiraceae bacterium]
MGDQLDAVLKEALTDSLLSDYAGVIEKAEGENVSFSKRYLTRKEQMLRHPEGFVKKHRRYVAAIIFRVAAVAVIILMSLAAGAALVKGI